MAMNELRTWLIAYDIRDPERLRRVHRYLVKRAVPVQYSVFVTRATTHRIGTIKSGLADLIDRMCDDVRIYHVPERAEATVFGKQYLPHGIHILTGAAQPAELSFTPARRRATFQDAREVGEEVTS
jgi:CRISPR-associated protein Cas2